MTRPAPKRKAPRKVAPKRGRPPTFDRPAIMEKVLSGLREGTPLTHICAQDGMPSDDTIRNWGEEDAAIGRAIARAREVGFDKIAADVLPIADDISEEPASRRVRVEARLKLLAKWDPKRYGDRIDHTSSDGSMSPRGLTDFYARPAEDGEG